MICLALRPILENFANFVVPVVNAGATYCRRKCFRTVLGRKCGSFQDQKDDGGTRHLYGHAVGRSVRYLITAQVCLTTTFFRENRLSPHFLFACKNHFINPLFRKAGHKTNYYVHIKLFKWKRSDLSNVV